MRRSVIKVIMWKNYIERKRRVINSIWEVVAPVVIFYLIFSWWKKIMETPSISQYFDNPNTRISGEVESPFRIFYYPSTHLTDRLMISVEKKLGKKKVASIYNKTGLYPLDNPEMFDILIPELQTLDCIVLFKDMNDDKWPEKFRYVIQMKKDNDSRLSSIAYLPFMKLQLAIDSSYIEMLSGNYLDMALTVQKVPLSGLKLVDPKAPTYAFAVATLAAMIAPFIITVTRLISERSVGMEVLMQVAGVSLEELYSGHALNVLPGGLIFSMGATIISKFSSILSKANGLLIFMFFVLYYSALMCAAVVFSFLLGGVSRHADVLTSFLYILIWIPIHILFKDVAIPRPLWPLSGLLIHLPLYRFWYQSFRLEIKGQGLTLKTMFKSGGKQCSVFSSYMDLLGQILLFSFLGWYLSQVRPGKYGYPYPWNFLCTKKYWSKGTKAPLVEPEYTVKPKEEVNQQYFEPPPAHSPEVGIKLVDVSKEFGSTKVLNRTSMDIYKEEITVLLGHNGAGKTTLISIITCMLVPTTGQIFLNGVDITDRKEISIGYCPQHNVNFTSLTVLEHAKLFAMLRGANMKEAHASSLDLLRKVNLETKADTRVGQLSGGMKRRVQLICALSGSPSILILDEPTSGLDVETRRTLWNLLLAYRGQRTMVVTTHFMEEADTLGDRIAALHSGELRCYATPMFLKKAMGTGYLLKIKTIGKPNTEDITKTIQSIISNAILKERLLNSLSYDLPANESNNFTKLFEALEGDKFKLAIDAIALGGTSLEDVFIRLCSDTGTEFLENIPDVVPLHTKLVGFKLYRQQLEGLLLRQMRYNWNNKINFLIFTIVPLMLIYLLSTRDVVVNNEDTELKESDKMMSSDNSNLTVSLKSPTNISIRSAFDDYLKSKLKNEYHDSQNSNNQSSQEKRNHIVDIDINNSYVKVLYKSIDLHAAPKALNALSNVLASYLLKRSTGDIITTVNQPLLAPRRNANADERRPRSLMHSLIFIQLISLLLQMHLIYKVSLPIQERITGSRHNYIMNGCSVLTFWTTTLIYHMITSYILVFLPALIIIVTLDLHDTFVHSLFIALMVYVLFVGCMAMLSFMFFCSYFMPPQIASAFFSIFIFIFGIPLSLWHFLEEAQPQGSYRLYMLRLISLFVPNHTFSLALSMIACTGSFNAILIMNHIPDELLLCYLCLLSKKEANNFAADSWVIILTMQFLFYFTLVILIEKNIFKKRCKCPEKETTLQPCVDKDQNVLAEAAYVAQCIKLPTNQITDMVLVHQLYKYYNNIIRKPFYAVNGINFSVKTGECFGLLGVNGAGKTTTFKMITAEEIPTGGEIMINRILSTERKEKYLRGGMGYCPQFFGIDDFLTGKQILQLTLSLRGFYPKDISAETKNWIDIVGLQKYANHCTSTYSGGCKRRIATAVAMCGEAPLALLDEPTTGVDVSARRKVWAALRRGLSQGRSIIITSHSMDEMEVLCSRIAIMSAGCIVALGTALDLRIAHSSGYVVILKVQREEITTDGEPTTESKRNVLKEEMNKKFKCTLKEEHETRLNYYLDKDMTYSELFRKLEDLKQAFIDSIEDYWVSETTLEEVFLSHAKTQQAGVKS